MSEPKRKITKRACDGCKIRKVKCSGLSPCDGCVAVRISCTYLRHPGIRGPRKLRQSTLKEIALTQRQQRREPVMSPPGSIPIILTEITSAPVIVTAAKPNPRIPVPSLVFHLCVFRLRMFPVWPVVKVEEVIATLQRNEEDVETYALACAVGAATVSQLKLTRASLGGDAVTAEMMEEECQKSRVKMGAQANLTTLRIAFFLHVYHENQVVGGIKSLLYLREAITVGQMMGLHKESSYITLSSEEQQTRRRILWLLFVTERGVAMLHKLPVVLKPNIAFPLIDRDDETFVLPAFQKLVNLFWVFDQSGAFDILQDSDTDFLGLEGMESPNKSCVDLLQRKLLEIPVEGESINDVQTADICVTRQWMRAMLWKFSVNHGLSSSISTDQVTSLSYPFQIAREFLSVISRLPSSAIEAHGQGMELKIYEIASSVTEAIAKSAFARGNLAWSSTSSMDQPGDILNQLQRILSSCRGGNKTLVSLLCNEIAAVQNGQMLLMEPSDRIIEEEDSPEQWQAENANDMNGHMSFGAGMNTGNMDDQLGFNNQAAYQELPAAPEFGEDSHASNRPQAASISDSNTPSRILSSSRQQPQQPFLHYVSWDIEDATPIVPTSTEVYSQIQQTFNSSVTFNSSAFDLSGVDGMWADSGELGLGIDGSGPEAIEQWN